MSKVEFTGRVNPPIVPIISVSESSALSAVSHHAF